jgi:hypothetical protein
VFRAVASAHSTDRVPSASGAPCDLLRADRRVPRHGMSLLFFAALWLSGCSEPHEQSFPPKRFLRNSQFSTGCEYRGIKGGA